MEGNSQRSSDEIELIDLLRILIKRYRLIIAGTLLTTLVGVGASFMLSQKYEYTTIVQIGKTVPVGDKNDQPVLIESPETLRAKAKDVYIPLAQKKVIERDPTASLPRVSASNPKNSDLLCLVSKAKVSDQQAVVGLHQAVVEKICSDCAGLTKGQLLPLEAAIARAQLSLETLQDPLLKTIRENKFKAEITKAQNAVSRLKGTEDILQNRLSVAGDKRKLLESQVAELKTALKRVYDIRLEAAAKTDSESKAMTLLMLDRQIEQDRSRLAEMQDRLLFQLDEDKKQLEQQIADNVREQDQHKNRIDELNNALLKAVADNMHEQQLVEQQIAELQGRLDLTEQTKAVSVALSSLGPVSPKKPLIVVLAFLLGSIGMIMLAFLFEYLQQHKLDDR